MKKIAFVCSSNAKGGLEINLIKTANKFIESGNYVLVIGISNSYIIDSCLKYSIPYQIIKKPIKYFDIFSAINLKKILKKYNIKNVIVFDNYDTDFASLCKLLNNNLNLIYHQNMQIGGNKKDFFHTIRYSKFDYWITTLNFLKNDVIRLSNYPEQRIKIIPIGIEEEFIRTNIDKSVARNFFQLDIDDFVIGVIGRIDYQKGQLILIKALEKLKIENIKVLIVGEPTVNEGYKYLKMINEYMNNNNLIKSIRFYNFIENTNYFYSAIDIFCLSSLSETYGLVTIEALIKAVPVIASNLGGTPEILNYGTYGELFESGNENDLADKIKNMYENYQFYKTKAISQRDEILSKYNKNQEIASILELLVD